MKVRNVKKLIDALESGKFTKGKGALNFKSKNAKIRNFDKEKADLPIAKCNKNTRFCCLGVAECIMPAKSRKDHINPDGAESGRYKAIKKWLGASDLEFNDLIHVNDNTKTFKQVVEYLKGEWVVDE